MDRKKSILNVSISIIFRVIILIGSVVVRRFLIDHIGNEGNGLDSLYVSLIGFLTVAELGVGSAITFCMYKPIVEKDTAKIAALYQLFVKAYRIIGVVIFALGVAVVPCLPYLARDYGTLDVNMGTTFVIMLISIVMSYVFSAKTSLINAYKNNYITTAISSIGIMVQYALQIVVIVVMGSFEAYLACRIIAVLLQWGLTELYTNKQHQEILRYSKVDIDEVAKREITDKIKAMFMHRIGAVLVSSTDSVIISTFIGVTLLGKYSNYTTIAVAMVSLISLFFSPLTSVIGHSFVAEKDKTEYYFKKLYFLNFALGVVFFLGYYAVIDNLVAILFGADLELAKSVAFVITVNYFVQFMRQAGILFKDATGTFYNDRWKPVFEGSLNIVLSVLLVKLLSAVGGEELGVVGVIAATIVTNLAICHIVEPYVLYKYAFNKSAKKYMTKNYLYIAMFVAALVLMNALMQTNGNQFVELLINGTISVGVSAGVLGLAYVNERFIDGRAE